MAIWKTKWGWRADFLLNGERIMAAGFFKYKDEARQWIIVRSIMIRGPLMRKDTASNAFIRW